MKTLLSTLSVLSVVTFGFSAVTQAKDERMGVATLEDKQLRNAIVTAQTPEVLPNTLNAEMVIRNAGQLADSTPTQLELNVTSSLAPVTLEEEIQQQQVQGKLELFGYDMFSGVSTTFAPITDMPVPYDYVIGPGDTFTIQAFSATNVQYA